MNAQQLKNSILQMAVQGKLVPQDPNDEPASVLLERIRKEKEKLIKEGKIKKEKNPSYIFQGEDNLPYEKVGKNEPICIADEVPFEIPENWAWVRLGNIGDWGSGATPSRTTPEYYNGNIPWLKTGDLNDGYIDSVPEFISELALEKTSVRLNPIGSVLIAMYGATIGKLGIANIALTTNQACCACLPLSGVFNEYVFYFLMSHKKEFIKRGEGGAQPNISKEKIVATLLPLPPEAEQHRIVAKIKTILPYIDKYATAEDEVDKLNTSFPELLKKSILQQAVMGKLVPQNPNEEPASVLLEKIRAEKDALIKAGKLKKDKHESIIYRRDNSYYEKTANKIVCIDEIMPFKIPDSWMWTRLGSVISIFGRIGFRGYTKSDMVQESNGAITISPSNIQGMNTVFIENSYISWDKYYESPEIMIFEDDLLLVKTGSSYGKCGLVKSLPEKATINPQLVVLKNILIDRKYLLYVLNSTVARKQYEDFVIGTSIPTFSQEKLASLLIPVPPLHEQERIVRKIEELSFVFGRLRK